MERLTTELCDAGRTAFFGGRWKGIEPCPEIGRHVIGSPGGVTMRFCDKHFAEVNAAGLVTEPYVGEEGFERKMAEDADAPAHSLMRFRGGPLDRYEVAGPDPAPPFVADERPEPQGRYVRTLWKRPVAEYRWRPFGARV